MMRDKEVREPLFHIVKRDGMKAGKRVAVYAIALAIALVLTSVFCALSSKNDKSPIDMIVSLFSGAFGTERKIFLFLRDTALLLIVALALIPAFKMKFWNLGANGQITISSLACYACMISLKDSAISEFLYVLILIVASITAGIIWALIPAIFKAFFKTNETLFTLMMNYIAAGLVTVMISVWFPKGSGSVEPIEHGIPAIGTEHRFILVILLGALVTAIMYFYLSRSKHGYEISVVGESENTAKYAGMNVKKIVIRTLILSGAICGLVGLLLTGSISKTVSTNLVDNRGFTAIMAAWLGKFSPFIVIGTSAFITFISRGAAQVKQDFGFTNDALASTVLGVIYFFIIGCEFFLSYRLMFREKKNKAELNFDIGKGAGEETVSAESVQNEKNNDGGKE